MGILKLKPGILVAAATGVVGGVEYLRSNRTVDRDDRTETVEWETRRVTADAEEHRLANKTRQTARTLIGSVCAYTPFGAMICPGDREADLDEKIAEAEALVDEFNASSKFSTIKLSIMRARIAADDAEAIESIRREISFLLTQLDGSVADGDVKSIRDVADRATQLRKLVADDAVEDSLLGEAVKAARKVASDVVKRVEKEGEKLATVLSKANRAPISVARFAFGDEDVEVPEDAQASLPAVSMARVAAVAADGLEEEEVEGPLSRPAARVLDDAAEEAGLPVLPPVFSSARKLDTDSGSEEVA